MPRPRKELPKPQAGFIYTGAMSTFIVLKLLSKPPRVKVYSTSSRRVSTIREDAFLTEYGLTSCKTP